jgi:hypothetical protein
MKSTFAVTWVRISLMDLCGVVNYYSLAKKFKNRINLGVAN